MRRFGLLFAIVCVACLAVQAQLPEAGVVHSSVAVAADSSNSYALYLPSNYSPQKRWPLLLVFDPFARGEVSVKLFHAAAEKYGFIVVGSNNIRNFKDPSDAIRLLWADIKQRYVDARRVYTSGLSGGARIASSVALACKNCIAAVIACGAGLPQGATVPGPEASDWFLVAGTTDFNYPEMLHLKESLEAHNAVSRFVIFDGSHGWMPPELADSALAWLQLRAMVKSLIPADKGFVGRQFDARLSEAQSAQKRGDILQAVRAYQEIAADFRTFRDVKEVEASARSLSGSEDFRKAKKAEKAILELQDDITGKLDNLITGADQEPENHTTYGGQIESLVSSSYRDQRETSNNDRKQAISRALASAFSFAVETGQKEMLAREYLRAREMFQLCETILPDSAWASYLLATAYAQLGENKKTIDALKKARQKGLTSRKSLDDAAFDHLRNDEAFKQFVASLPEAAK